MDVLEKQQGGFCRHPWSRAEQVPSQMPGSGYPNELDPGQSYHTDARGESGHFDNL